MRGYQLSIKNKDGKRLVCTKRSKIGDDKNGVTVDLKFSDPFSSDAIFGGVKFASEKEGFWYWYQFRKLHPDKTQGWYASCMYFEE